MTHDRVGSTKSQLLSPGVMTGTSFFVALYCNSLVNSIANFETETENKQMINFSSASHRIQHPKKHQTKVLVLNIYEYVGKGRPIMTRKQEKMIFRIEIQDRRKDNHKSRRIR